MTTVNEIRTRINNGSYETSLNVSSEFQIDLEDAFGVTNHVKAKTIFNHAITFKYINSHSDLNDVLDEYELLVSLIK